MRSTPSFLPAFLFIMVLVILGLLYFSALDAKADSVFLKNGNVIYGKTVQYNETTTKLTFSNGGFMMLKTKEIDRIQLDNKDQFEINKTDS